MWSLKKSEIIDFNFCLLNLYEHIIKNRIGYKKNYSIALALYKTKNNSIISNFKQQLNKKSIETFNINIINKLIKQYIGENIHSRIFEFKYKNTQYIIIIDKNIEKIFYYCPIIEYYSEKTDCCEYSSDRGL